VTRRRKPYSGRRARARAVPIPLPAALAHGHGRVMQRARDGGQWCQECKGWYGPVTAQMVTENERIKSLAISADSER
jgi:hypothetical protein